MSGLVTSCGAPDRLLRGAAAMRDRGSPLVVLDLAPTLPRIPAWAGIPQALRGLCLPVALPLSGPSVGR